jgi:integrase
MAYTGQRVSDAAKMGRQDERAEGKAIAVVQAKLRKNKRRVKIEVPIHDNLRKAINACGVEGRMIYLSTQYDRPYSVKGLGQDFSRWASEAGLSEGKTAHGVRKLAGSRLAEAGCSEKEIMAVLGLSSIAEATLYTEAANQKKLANAAMKKVRQAEKDARKEAALTAGGKVIKRAPLPVKRAKKR